MTEKRTIIGASVPPELHADFSDALYRLGLSASPLIRLFAEYVVEHGKVPEGLKVPDNMIRRAVRQGVKA